MGKQYSEKGYYKTAKQLRLEDEKRNQYRELLFKTLTEEELEKLNLIGYILIGLGVSYNIADEMRIIANMREFMGIQKQEKKLKLCQEKN
jgi:hypothetical protein